MTEKKVNSVGEYRCKCRAKRRIEQAWVYYKKSWSIKHWTGEAEVCACENPKKILGIGKGWRMELKIVKFLWLKSCSERYKETPTTFHDGIKHDRMRNLDKIPRHWAGGLWRWSGGNHYNIVPFVSVELQFHRVLNQRLRRGRGVIGLGGRRWGRAKWGGWAWRRKGKRGEGGGEGPTTMIRWQRRRSLLSWISNLTLGCIMLDNSLTFLLSSSLSLSLSLALSISVTWPIILIQSML